MSHISAGRSHAPCVSPAHPADLHDYDTIIVAFSGGKDATACLLTLIDAGVLSNRIELHHHDVDGRGAPFMDWPSTTAYCRAIAQHFDVALYLSWKEGGFLREMMRHNQPTAPICFELPNGKIGTVGGAGPLGTRLRFPQVTANLNQRWCSAYLKVDPMAALIRAQPRFLGRRTLIVTVSARRKAAPAPVMQSSSPIARTRARARADDAMLITGALSTISTRLRSGA